MISHTSSKKLCEEYFPSITYCRKIEIGVTHFGLKGGLFILAQITEVHKFSLMGRTLFELGELY